MKKSLVSGLLVMALALSFVAQASAAKAVYFYGFDGTTDPWLGRAYPGSNAYLDPTGVATGKAELLQLHKGLDGNSLAMLTNEGESAVWMQAEFMPQADTLVVEYDVMDIQGAARLAPIIYAAQGEPATLYDFQKIGYPLEKGAQRLQFEVSLKGIVGSDRPVVVALGFMNLDGYKTTQLGGVDNVKVTIYDQPVAVTKAPAGNQ